MPDLIAELRAAPHAFDLFKAISLLERSEPGRAAVGASLGVDESVRLAGVVGLGFAPSDIAGVADSGRAGPPLTLSSPALTLAGSQGPLPAPFTELLLERQRLRDLAGLDFLDIFNQRLLGLLYRGRRKHHVALHPAPASEAPLLRGLDGLSGLGRAEGARGPRGEAAWLRHAGLQGAAPRSMTSLLALLRDRLGIRFGGRQFAGAWLPLAHEERARLGGRQAAGSVLGEGPALGARGWDQEAGLELTTPALPAAEFQALLPGQPTHGLLAWLVARHLQRDLQVTLCPDVQSPPPARLGTPAAGGLAPRLGLSTWLRGPGGPGRPPLAHQRPRFLLSTGVRAHGH
jgi:type VI secretion system protein ImpH